MANKRMFSRDVVDGSRFIMLPHSAQNLYFHLGMHADDDGYCEYVSVIRLIAGNNADLRVLQENGFICVYNLYTLCIQDWYTHNKISPSRYSESKYLKTFPERDLPLESQHNPPLEPCIQSVYKVYEESSIGKGSIGKVSKEKKNKKKESELAQEVISLFSKIKANGRDHDVDNETHTKKFNIIIKALKKKGIKPDDQILAEFERVFKNKKAQHDDPDHHWNHFRITTLSAKDNFLSYMDEDPYESLFDRQLKIMEEAEKDD